MLLILFIIGNVIRGFFIQNTQRRSEVELSVFGEYIASISAGPKPSKEALYEGNEENTAGSRYLQNTGGSW